MTVGNRIELDTAARSGRCGARENDGPARGDEVVFVRDPSPDKRAWGIDRKGDRSRGEGG